MSKTAKRLLNERLTILANECYSLSLNLTEEDIKEQFQNHAKLNQIRRRLSEIQAIGTALEELNAIP